MGTFRIRFTGNASHSFSELAVGSMDPRDYDPGAFAAAANDSADTFILDLRDIANGVSNNARMEFYGDSLYQGDTDPTTFDTFKFILPDDWTLEYVGSPAPDGSSFWLRNGAGDIITRNFFVSGSTANIAIICFTQGSQVLMEDGTTKPVEDLRPGDRVITKDRGPQPVRLVHRSRITAETLKQFPNLRPIIFKAGAMGEHPDFRVSPQHRMFIVDARLRDALETDEALVPAKHLVNDHSILVDHRAEAVEYIHVMFDRHEIIRADNVWSESFYPGSYAMKANPELADEIRFVFPQLEEDETGAAYGDLARPALRKRDVKILWGGQK